MKHSKGDYLDTILVTGGAGFIGSHVCEELLESKNKVVCVDNFNNYYDPKTKRENLKKIIANKSFELHEFDILDRSKLYNLFLKIKIDKIIHLAARAGVRNSIETPLLYQRVNINGTLNLLNMANEFNVKNFVFGSSSSVYGDSKKIPFKEEHECNPISPYGVTKLTGESYCRYYSEMYDSKIAVLRFFTVFGPRGRPDMAVYKFTKAIDEKRELTMYGDGSSMRDYTFVSDVSKGIIAAMYLDADFEIMNLGNSNPIKLKEFIGIIETSLDKTAIIKKLPMQEGDVFQTYADISKAKRLLKYNPKTDIKKGISQFVEWYRGNNL